MEEEDKAYYEQLSKAYFESSVQFDKQILFIASGALGISFTFINDIIDLSCSVWKGILFTSWILFALVILFSLLSHYYSKQAINNKMENIEKENHTQSGKLNDKVVLLNKLMIAFNILGLFTLLIFIYINI